MSFFGLFGKSDPAPATAERQEPTIDTKSSDFGAITVLDKNATVKPVTPSQALKLETVYTCIRDKAESIGQLPLKLYRRTADGRELVESGREWRIFTQKPNDFMNIQQLLEMMVASLETRGAFYAYVSRNKHGNIAEIIPFFNQGNVVPNHDVRGNVYYHYVFNDGTIGPAYAYDDLLIVKSFTLNGYTPISPISQNALALGLAKAQEEEFYSLNTDGITSQFALKTDKRIDDENARNRLREEWSDFRGLKGVKKVPLMEDGLSIEHLKLSPQDAELLKSRGMSVNRICRIFRVPIERVGIAETAKATSMLDVDEAYMRSGLNPVLVKFEHAYNALLPEHMTVKVDRKAFYAGSPYRLVEAVEREVKGGLASINEGRADLGRESVEGGDVFAVDNNNVTYATWKELPSVREQINGRAANGNEVTTDE